MLYQTQRLRLYHNLKTQRKGDVEMRTIYYSRAPVPTVAVLYF